MKKFFLTIMGLLLSVNVYAGIISYNTLSGDAGVSYSHFNTSFSSAYNEINGNLEDVNLLADTLTERVFADSANPVVRDSELIGNMTYTGMLPPTSTTLVSITTAGTSYVNGYRVVTDATSKTYTASKDTYVYIDINGAFQYEEVANGAAAPTTPANSLLLAKVVTDSDNVTSVTDLRQLTPLNLRIYQDVKSGCVISRDPTTATIATIGRGEIELGTTSKVRRNTSQISVDISTSGTGGLDTGSAAANTFYYIFALADTDNTTNYKGIASLSATDATGVTGERLVGWCYTQSASIISPDSIGAYRGLGGDAPNVIRVNKSGLSTLITSGALTNVETIKFYSSGRPVEFKYLVNGTTASDGAVYFTVMSLDSVAIPESENGLQVQTLVSGYTGYGIQTGLVKNINAGTHTFDLKLKANNNFTVKNYTIVIEEK
jgi:hypothetical protein